VVEDQGLRTAVDRPGVTADLDPAVEHDHLGGAQEHPDLGADQPDRDRVVTLTHRDASEPVHARGQQQPGLEPVVGQRRQQRCLDGEVLPYGPDPVFDPAGVIAGVGDVDTGVEQAQAVDLGNRDEMVAAEPADLTFNAAFSCAPSIPGMQ